MVRSDGGIRIYGGYSVTLNKVLVIDNYPIPNIEKIFATLHDGEEFPKLDLLRACNQLVLDDDSSKLCIKVYSDILYWVMHHLPFSYFNNRAESSQ